MGDRAFEAVSTHHDDESLARSFESPMETTKKKISGIFSQTLLPSPVIQWILPAHLRSKHRNDVVFVGQRQVQVKEAVAGGYLVDRIGKSNFQGTIIAAEVLNVGTEFPWESQLQTGNIYDGPTQLLLLSLDMRELLFMYCSSEVEPEFVCVRRALPVDVRLADRFGKHLAVDPKYA